MPEMHDSQSIVALQQGQSEVHLQLQGVQGVQLVVREPLRSLLLSDGHLARARSAKASPSFARGTNVSVPEIAKIMCRLVCVSCLVMRFIFECHEMVECAHRLSTC